MELTGWRVEYNLRWKGVGMRAACLEMSFAGMWKKTVCSYAPLLQANRQTNLHQILHRPLHQLGEGS